MCRQAIAEALELAVWCAATLAIIAGHLLLAQQPAGRSVPEFASVDDRPVLESVDKVWHARATGRVAFRYDGMLYIVENLPEEYLAYSEHAVRMP